MCRVKPGGVRSYIVQYRDRQTGESRRKTIGQHGPLLTFHKAREQARIILAEALNGRDPVRAERAARAAPNVAALAEQYLAQHAVPKKRPRGAKSDRALLERLVLPRLGSKKVTAVHARDIHALHVAMSDTPYQANRLLALLSKMFALAVHWGMRGDNPVKGIQRFHEERRERWLSDTELKRLLGVLATHPNRRAANAVRLQLLTGARIGEVLAAPLVGDRLRSRGLDQALTSHQAEADAAPAAVGSGHGAPLGLALDVGTWGGPPVSWRRSRASRCRTSRTSGAG